GEAGRGANPEASTRDSRSRAARAYSRAAWFSGRRAGRTCARRGIVVHLRLGKKWLARPQGIHELHVLLDVHVVVVSCDVDEQRNLELVDVVERRAVLVHVMALGRQAAVPVVRVDGLTLALDALPR